MSAGEKIDERGNPDRPATSDHRSRRAAVARASHALAPSALDAPQLHDARSPPRPQFHRHRTAPQRRQAPERPDHLTALISPTLPGQHHTRRSATTPHLPRAAARRRGPLGLSRHRRTNSTPPALQQRRTHLRRLSGGCDSHALRARALTSRKPLRRNSNHLRPLRPAASHHPGQRATLAHPGTRCRSLCLHARHRLEPFHRTNHHRRLLKKLSLLLVRRTCKSISRNAAPRGWAISDAGSGGIRDKSGAVKAIWVWKLTINRTPDPPPAAACP